MRFVAAFILAAAFGPPAPPVAAPAQLVFVVGQGPMRPGDELLRRRLERRGYGVAVITDGLLRESDWAGKHAVVVSSSAEPALAARLREASVPVVVLNPFLFAPLGLSGPALGSDFGYDTTLGRTGVTVRDPRHTLAAGGTGDVGVASRPIDIGWARPASDAAVIATVSGEPRRVVDFAYESGAALVGLDAPARRVGSTSAIAQPTEMRPLWELYSWRSASGRSDVGSTWEFSILSGATSSMKQPSQVFDPAAIIKGLEELGKILDRLPPNSDVIWIESVRMMKKQGKDYVRGEVVKGMERLTLPPSAIMDRVRVMVRSRGMHFVGVTGGDHTSVEE